MKAKKTKAKKAKKTYCVMCPTWEIKRPEICSNTLKAGTKTLYFCTRRCKDRYAKGKAS